MSAPNDARELVRRLEREEPEVVRLARLLSPAARVEPELIRRMRLAFLKGSDPGLEADLWLGPLVVAQDRFGAVLRPEVADLLRRELARDRALLDRAWREIEAAHASLAPVLQLEERVTVSALRGDRDAMQRWLGAAVVALPGDRASGIARWALRTLPGLPARARASEAARVLASAARARVGGEARASSSTAFANVVREARRLPVGVRRLPGAIELSEPPADGAAMLDVPVDGADDDLEVSIETPDDGGWEADVVSLPRGTSLRRPVEDGAVRVRSALLDALVLVAPSPPRSASASPASPASSDSPPALAFRDELLDLGVEEPDDVALVIDADHSPSVFTSLADVVEARDRGLATVMLAPPPASGASLSVQPESAAKDERGDSAVMRLVDELLGAAVLLGARELRIDAAPSPVVTLAFEDEAWPVVRVAPSAARSVVARVKILADLDLAERRVPQTNRVRWGVHPPARVVATTAGVPRGTSPSDGPEAIVLRIEDPGLGDDHHVVRLPAAGAPPEETRRRLRRVAVEIERRRFARFAREVRGGEERFRDFSAEIARHETLVGRDALLAHLAEWPVSTDLPEPRAMLVVGRRGTGKTALTLHAVKRWREDRHLVALHVVDRDAHERWADVLRSLALQVERRTGVAAAASRPSGERLRIALGRVFAEERLPRWQPLILVIDGADAIEGLDVDGFLASLLGGIAKRPQLRVVLTARPDSRVAEAGYSPAADRHVVDFDDAEWRKPADEAMKAWLEEGLGERQVFA